jgi:hypothetical protein
MDKLADAIRAKEAKVEDLGRQITALDERRGALVQEHAVVQIELRTLQEFAASIDEPIAPSSPTGAQAAPRKKRGFNLRGKQQWELTPPYLKLVKAMVAVGNPLFATAEISSLAAGLGLELAPKRAGDRMRKYASTGLAEKVGERFRITERAIHKLNLAPPLAARLRRSSSDLTTEVPQ